MMGGSIVCKLKTGGVGPMCRDTTLRTLHPRQYEENHQWKNYMKTLDSIWILANGNFEITVWRIKAKFTLKRQS